MMAWLDWPGSQAALGSVHGCSTAGIWRRLALWVELWLSGKAKMEGVVEPGQIGEGELVVSQRLLGVLPGALQQLAVATGCDRLQEVGVQGGKGGPRQ